MKVFCILSDERAAQSKSPIMFSRVLKRQGINGTYVPFVVKPQDLGQAVHSIRVLHMAGANITVPYKEAVIPLLDVLSEGAQYHRGRQYHCPGWGSFEGIQYQCHRCYGCP